MLAQTVRNNIMTKKKMDVRTKATKFSSLFTTAPKDTDISLDELLDAKISSFVEPIEEEPIIEEVVNEVDEEYSIVENPDEAVVEFPIAGVELTEKLPFFKSITAKLVSIYGAGGINVVSVPCHTV